MLMKLTPGGIGRGGVGERQGQFFQTNPPPGVIRKQIQGRKLVFSLLDNRLKYLILGSISVKLCYAEQERNL
jgi:hypothetical protein